jgi:fatty-acyl-CoA synthase
VAVYSVPDPRSGDQVMVALEMLPGRVFDPQGFQRFLEVQSDLGTKWPPAFLRITDGLPQTASGKVTKEPLRVEGWWAGGEPVFRRVEGTLGYVPLDAGRCDELRAEFRHHGRDSLVGG